MEEGWRRLLDEQWLRDCSEAACRFRERAEVIVRPGEESPMCLCEEDE
jgi:hypothetical protein